jgi:hypothetical protein
MKLKNKTFFFIKLNLLLIRYGEYIGDYKVTQPIICELVVLDDKVAIWVRELRGFCGKVITVLRQNFDLLIRNNHLYGTKLLFYKL